MGVKESLKYGDYRRCALGILLKGWLQEEKDLKDENEGPPRCCVTAATPRCVGGGLSPHYFNMAGGVCQGAVIRRYKLQCHAIGLSLVCSTNSGGGYQAVGTVIGVQWGEKQSMVFSSLATLY